MPTPRTVRTLSVALLCLMGAAAPLLAQDSKSTLTADAADITDVQTPLSVTAKVLEAKVREAHSNSALSQAERDQLLELYDKTRSSLETIQANNAKSESYA